MIPKFSPVSRFAAILSFAIFLPGFSFSSFSQSQKVILKAGTMIPLRTTTFVSSEYGTQGQVVMLQVEADVRVDGKLVIPKGSMGYGQVTHCQKSKGGGKPGMISMKVMHVAAPDGVNVDVSAPDLQFVGGDKRQDAMWTGIGGCFLLPCVGALGYFLVKGEDAQIQAGNAVIANVRNDVSLTGQ